MNVRVQMFALARDLAGHDAVELRLADGATVANLRESLALVVPALQPILRHVMFAVNMEYASDDAAIPQGAAVACIPPVSGG
jgi:sulfur-carrier protein